MPPGNPGRMAAVRKKLDAARTERNASAGKGRFGGRAGDPADIQDRRVTVKETRRGARYRDDIWMDKRGGG